MNDTRSKKHPYGGPCPEFGKKVRAMALEIVYVAATIIVIWAALKW